MFYLLALRTFDKVFINIYDYLLIYLHKYCTSTKNIDFFSFSRLIVNNEILIPYMADLSFYFFSTAC